MKTVSKRESEPSTLNEAELSTIQGGMRELDWPRVRDLIKQIAPLLKSLRAGRPAVTPVPLAQP